MNVYIILLSTSREQGQNACSRTNREHIIHSGRKGSQQIEAAENDDSQVQGIIVEYREGGGLEVGNLVLLPQYPLVLLLLAHLLVLGQLLHQLPGDGVFSLDRNFVFQRKLCVAIRHRYQIGGDQGEEGEWDQAGVHVDHVDPPEEPDGHG